MSIPKKIGTKEIKAENRTALLSTWIKREPSVRTMPPLSSAIVIASKNKDRRDGVANGFLASLMCKGNDYANQNYTALLSSPYVSAGALSITPNNFEKAMVIYTVRRLPKATWLNDRDQMMQPDKDALADSEFVSDCLVWALMSGANSTVSLVDVEYEGESYRIKNELYPFLTKHIKTWKHGLADFRTQASAKHVERYAATWLEKHILSNEAREVMRAAEKVYRFFYEHLDELPWPKYKIKKWDVGWWQIHMALTDAGIGVSELETLKLCHKELGKKLMTLIYEYHFIEPDMIRLEEFSE